MKMKNLGRSLVAAVTMLGASQYTLAGGLNDFDEVAIVPWAVCASSGATTAVGVLSRSAGDVHWAFFDSNGNRLGRGMFMVLADEFTPFLWCTEAAGTVSGLPALQDVPGFLVFGLDSNSDGLVNDGDADSLAANAFFVDTSANDVKFVPTLEITGITLSQNNPNNWTSSPIASLGGFDGKFAAGGGSLDIQFLIDGAAGGDNTNIYIFTTNDPGSLQNAFVHNGAGVSGAVTISTLSDSLNIINPETVSGVTGSFFGNGYIRWTVPAAVNGAFVFSIAESPAFGAAQTVLANVD